MVASFVNFVDGSLFVSHSLSLNFVIIAIRSRKNSGTSYPSDKCFFNAEKSGLNSMTNPLSVRNLNHDEPH